MHRLMALILGQGHQQMLKRGIFVIAVAGEGQRAMQTFLEIARQHVPSGLFKSALQWMLVLARQVHDLCNFGLRYFVRVNAADANPLLMYMKHYM